MCVFFLNNDTIQHQKFQLDLPSNIWIGLDISSTALKKRKTLNESDI